MLGQGSITELRPSPMPSNKGLLRATLSQGRHTCKELIDGQGGAWEDTTMGLGGKRGRPDGWAEKGRAFLVEQDQRAGCVPPRWGL